jgi:hypothetical protein
MHGARPRGANRGNQRDEVWRARLHGVPRGKGGHTVPLAHGPSGAPCRRRGTGAEDGCDLARARAETNDNHGRNGGRARSEDETRRSRVVSAPSSSLFSGAGHAVSSAHLLHVWCVGIGARCRALPERGRSSGPPIDTRDSSGRYAGIGVRASCICVRIAQKCVSALPRSGALMPASVLAELRQTVTAPELRPRAVSLDRASDLVSQAGVLMRVNTNTGATGGGLE